jgi:hypothetical protein
MNATLPTAANVCFNAMSVTIGSSTVVGNPKIQQAQERRHAIVSTRLSVWQTSSAHFSLNVLVLVGVEEARGHFKVRWVRKNKIY